MSHIAAWATLTIAVTVLVGCWWKRNVYDPSTRDAEGYGDELAALRTPPTPTLDMENRPDDR